MLIVLLRIGWCRSKRCRGLRQRTPGCGDRFVATGAALRHALVQLQPHHAGELGGQGFFWACCCVGTGRWVFHRGSRPAASLISLARAYGLRELLPPAWFPGWACCRGSALNLSVPHGGGRWGARSRGEVNRAKAPDRIGRWALIASFVLGVLAELGIHTVSRHALATAPASASPAVAGPGGHGW